MRLVRNDLQFFGLRNAEPSRESGVINWSLEPDTLIASTRSFDLVSNSLDQIFFGLIRTAAWPGGKARLLGNGLRDPDDW